MKQYCDAIEKQRETFVLKPGQPKSNRESANNLFKVLKKVLCDVEGIKLSRYYQFLEENDIKQVLDNMRFEAENQPLVFETNKAAKDKRGFYLAEKDGKELLGMYDFGPMNIGWFKETDYHQLALVFKDPNEEGKEIGFSLNSQGGLTVIICPMRYELFPSFALLSVSNKGYIPMTYYNLNGDDYVRYELYGEDGARREANLWEKFLAL